MKLTEAINGYLIDTSDLSSETQTWYSVKLRLWSEWCTAANLLTLDDIRPTHIKQFIEAKSKQIWRGKPISTYTLHGYVQVIKGFLAWCSEEEMYHRRLVDKIDLPHVEQKVIDTFTPQQIKALFAACDREPYKEHQFRDKAMLAIFLDTGVRVSGLVGLTLGQVHITPQDAYLVVKGKGQKWYEVGLGKQSRSYLWRYLSRYRQDGDTGEHIFIGHKGNPLTRKGADSLIKRLGKWAGIEGIRISCHSVRHTFAVESLRNGTDIYRLSKLLNHSSVKVTEHYLRAFQQREARQNVKSVLDSI